MEAGLSALERLRPAEESVSNCHCYLVLWELQHLPISADRKAGVPRTKPVVLMVADICGRRWAKKVSARSNDQGVCRVQQ